MTGITMYDSVDLGQIPADAQFLAAYVDGRFANVAEARDRFPHARILSIAVNAAHDADCLDVETGDALPADAPGWYDRQRARGLERPCLYASASVMQDGIIPLVRSGRIARPLVRLWSAHYAGLHICSPRTCGLVSIDMDGTQWTDRAWGRDLDESLLLADFFGAAPAPKPAPAPVPGWQEAMMNKLPVLQEGAADKAGEVSFVHRMQALVKVVGEITDLADAACQVTNGTFDAATKVAVQQVQAHAGLATDGVVGPRTWGVLVAGSAS